MNEVVFNTQSEADAQRALDNTAFLDSLSAGAYKDTTDCWSAESIQRLDGKWAYPCCPVVDYTGLVVEPYDTNNYN